MNHTYQKLFLVCTLGFFSISYAGHETANFFAAFLSGVADALEEERKQAEASAKAALEQLEREHAENRRRLEQLQKNSANQISPKEKMKQDLFTSLENRLKRVIDIDIQADTDKLALWKMKQGIVENAMKQGFSSFHFAERYVFDSLPGGILEVIRTKANELGKKKPQWSDGFLQTLDQEITREVTQTLASGKSVGQLFKNLNSRVDTYHKNYFKNSHEAPRPTVATTPATPSRPNLYPSVEQTQADANKIQEIFPKNDRSKTLQEFAQKTVNKKIFEASACSVCQEDYEELKKRANLPCGHQMCLACLHNWIFTKKRQGQTPTCPECRHPIPEKDYDADYVSSKL